MEQEAETAADESDLDEDDEWTETVQKEGDGEKEVLQDQVGEGASTCQSSQLSGIRDDIQ